MCCGDRLNPPPKPVIRDGREQVIPAREIVPGDVLLINPGDKIAADASLSSVQRERAARAKSRNERAISRNAR